MTLNEEIQDKTISHQHYLERYKSYQVSKYSKLIDEANKSISGIVASTDFQKTRKASLLKSIRESEAKFKKQFEKGVLSEGKEFTGFEWKWLNDLIIKLFGKYNIDVKTDSISDAKIYSLANDTPIMLDGGTTISLDDYIKKLFPDRFSAVKQTIEQSYLLGITNAETIKTLEGVLNKDAVKRFVRTTFNHLSSASRDEYYKSSKMIKGFQIVATLDSRTSQICRFLDGKVWYFDNEKASTAPNGNYPPYHYNCRTTTIPLTKSWRELGIDIDEMPKGTRSSIDGYVPAGKTYNEWLSGTSAENQKDALGAARYNLYKSGKIKIDQFADDGRLLTLAQLKRKYKL